MQNLSSSLKVFFHFAFLSQITRNLSFTKHKVDLRKHRINDMEIVDGNISFE